MFSKNKKRQLDYRELEKKYNSLELNYEILVEKVKTAAKKIEVSEDTLKILALLHDVCKANF